ncbi:DUF1996 domain-containing protein [Streptomyces sp. NPDC006553]|uniref:DUF1996 domain-containing protein n=1 Tax=unclassified Streptomyces TaxID=2593676 RepID=UPI00224FD094|nr:DUF1996 domain-containing protein [Streptomyces sp. NBC_00233]MCX5228753.1 DUF1996 domain-containing protein [Streptomyces sp. NBC_00233]
MNIIRRLLTGVGAVVVLATAGCTAAPTDHAAHSAHSAHQYTYTKAQQAAIVAQAAAPVRGAEFRADCSSSHRRGDDPIVFPGQAGRSHIHEFYGNRTANASSTLQSLAAGTTNCTPQTDLSSYWTPTLYQNGVPVAPERVTVYYQGITDPTRAVAHPRGLRYVVGNALATGPEQNPAARWSCVGRPESGRDFVNCPPGTKLENYLDFPTCWDGRNLDSPNHRDHMAYAAGPTCPAGHPVPVPRLELLITWPVTGGGLSLAGTRNGTNVTDAPGYTFHGDFFNAWDEGELRRRVTDCINAGYVCGTDGNPIQQ